MTEHGDSASLERWLAAELAWAPTGLLTITLDQAHRIVSSAYDPGDAAPRGVFSPGATLSDLALGQDLRARLEPMLVAALGGCGGSGLDVDTPGGLRLRLSLAPTFAGPGRPAGAILTLRNISPDEQAARRAQALRDRLAAILDNAADAILLIDQAGVIREANHAVARVFGWAPEDLVGRPVDILMDAPYRQDHGRYLDRYLQTGVSGILNVGPRRLPALRRGGERLWIELSVGEAWLDGARTFVGVCRDITDRLAQDEALRAANAELAAQTERSEVLARAEQAARLRAEAASQAKSRFLAAVSHELHTPLNGVLAAADLLAAQALPTGAGTLVDVVRRSGTDLLGLLNEVLDLSRMEAGDMPLVAAPFSPRELIDAAVAVWKPAARAKGLHLSLSPGDLPDHVIGDPGRLRQALSSLLNTAIRLADDGAVAVTASAVVDGATAALRLAVASRGLDPTAVAGGALFEPFALDRHGGRGDVGLGLTLAREIVALMGGTIIADPAPDGGTALVIDLNLPLAGASPPQAAHHEAPPSQPSLYAASPMRVLVAEDHPINRQVMALLLDELGVDYAMAEDGEFAVAAAEAERFDAILMDIRMPRMDGLNATRAIRGGTGPNARTPVIAVTAHVMPGEEPAVLAAGVDFIVLKPVSLEALAALLDQAPVRI